MTRMSMLAALVVLAGCKGKSESAEQGAAPAVGSGSAGSGSAGSAAKPHAAIGRAELNRWAVRENVPVYWIADANRNAMIDPDEVAALLFYPTTGDWVKGGAFTPAFEAAYHQIVTASSAPPPDQSTAEGKRQRLVGEDLDQGRATLVRSDLRGLSADDKAFVGHMLKLATLIDQLYDTETGAAALSPKVPADPASQSLFRRNRGPRCVGPATENDKLCSAIPGSPKQIFDIYPAALQADDKFCDKLEASAKSALDDHFSVIRDVAGKLAAVPYTEVYKPQMTVIADELVAAADSVKDPTEGPLVAYLRAASASFRSNDWTPADEAWAKMTVDNSKWYVRAAPDETYWEPCAHKAGLHLSFARISQASKEWQTKLVPVQQDMEQAIAAHAGAPYQARKVSFHLPDFIEIVINAGDDRDPLGATIGQSLPNWGPVANQGRGRTVAMTNLSTDPDSVAARRAQADSVLDAASMKAYTGTPEPGLVSTILHEATHNLGPAHEYKVDGKKAEEVFGGPIAQVMEELKAQTGALFLFGWLRDKKLISDDLATQGITDSIVWAFGHISQGMYTGTGERKTYSNLAAIQIGFLIDKGALTWDDHAMAANTEDKGAFTIHPDKLGTAIDELMTQIAGIKARGDRAAAEQLIKRYVDGTVVPQKVIAERYRRFPKPSYVYSVEL